MTLCRSCRWFKRKSSYGGLCWWHLVRVNEAESCDQWRQKVLR